MSIISVMGSLPRRIFFWAHLTCGVLAGLIILLMSATGVLLAYEHQLVDSATHSNRLAAIPAGPRLSADELAAKVRGQAEPGARLSLVFDADPAAPVTASAGRDTVALLNPYTGETLPDHAAGRRAFFGKVEQLHRWMGGSPRGTAANLIDVANLLFLFIIASGIYLWLPDVWRWRTVRGLITFKTKYINGKVRDFNWHHAFSFWALIPLFLIALSGVVMSYPWANRLVYAAFGEQAPQRAGPPGAAGGPGGFGAGQRGAGGAPRSEGFGGRDRNADAAAPGAASAGMEQTEHASLQQLLDAAIAQEGSWQRVTLPAQVRGRRAEIAVELKSDERRAPRRNIVLSTTDASVIEAPPVQITVQSPGQRARSWLRMVHTGEQYGIVGQTIAGLASLAACFLVYSGLALAFRRLIMPLFKRKPAPQRA